MKPLGICTNLLERERKGIRDGIDFRPYMSHCGIPYEEIDCYSNDIIEKLDDFSGIFWWYGNFVNADLMEAQNILDIAEKKGLRVYPNHNTAWHFDDKIAEMYAFKAAGANIPNSWVFYKMKECLDWIENNTQYPIVAKLRRGSGSNNVKLLRGKNQAIKYCKRMFSKGYNPSQSLVYKTYSKIQSTRDFKTFIDRFRKIPNFLKSRRYGKGMPDEKGYCYFQEFIPNDGYDLKVAVVGDKLGYFARHTRKGDFRASGGGDFYYDNRLITEQIIKEAFRIADELGTQCIGFDFVVDQRDGKGKIIEMCHGFDQYAVLNCGGFFDRNCTWHEDAPLNVAEEIIRNLYSDIIGI